MAEKEPVDEAAAHATCGGDFAPHHLTNRSEEDQRNGLQQAIEVESQHNTDCEKVEINHLQNHDNANKNRYDLHNSPNSDVPSQNNPKTPDGTGGYVNNGYSGDSNTNQFRGSMSKVSQTSGKSRDQDQVQSSGEALEALFDQLGHFGFYQCYVMILIAIPNILAAMYSLNYVFVADQVPFRCIVPECEGTYQVQFANNSAAALQSADACRRYRPLDPQVASCDRDYFHPNDTIQCDKFVYESMETIYSEFGLACQEWRRTLVGTVRNAALPLALLLTGYISDGWGRRIAFCILVVFAGGLGIVKSFSVNYQMYVSVEFFEAALGYGFNSAAYVMMVELARPSLRAAFACATGVAYGLGGVIFALIASQVRYWRTLLRVIHLPALLLPLYWLLLDESIRWLHVTRRTESAIAVMRKAANWNKVSLNEDLIKVLREEPDKTVARAQVQWLSVFRSRVLLARFIACAWCWVAAAFVYYGLTINSVSLSGDKYVNFALIMAMEIVASLLIMMALERFGRKRSIFMAFLLCGVACVTPYFISHEGASLALFFVGKLSISFAFNSLYVFTAELFPTAARSSALAAASLVGRLGSVLAPQTPLLSMYVQVLLYGGVSLSAALVVLLVPETRRAPLPARVADAERLRGAASTASAATAASAAVAARASVATAPSGRGSTVRT